jgi:histidyl-tRNA synthetase
VADVGGDRIPGVGFAMGDLVIGLVLKKYGKVPELRTVPSQVLVTSFSAQEITASMKIAQTLRSEGIAAEWYPSAERLPKQLKYADSLGIPLAVIVGPDEIRQGRATIKDLVKREQQTVDIGELAQAVRRRLVGTWTG